MSQLFRREAVEHQRQRLYGEVRLATPLSSWIISLVLALMVGGMIAGLIYGHYARKETVVGWLTPDKGLIRFYARQPGIIEKVHVKEGEDVSAGMPLLTVSLDKKLESGEAVVEALLGGIDKETAELRQRIELTVQQYVLDTKANRARQQQLTAEKQSLHAQKGAQRDRLVISEQLVKQIADLVQSGSISKVEQKRRQIDVLAQKKTLEELSYAIVQKQGEIALVKSRLQKLPLERQIELSKIRERLSALAQRRTEIERQGRLVIEAPTDARVASISVRDGQQVKTQSLQMTLLPKGAQLEAELFAPTRAAGFVQPGQHVRLLYDAFPFQKFGAARGRIVRISKTILDPREMAAAIQLSEPVFRVTVAVDKQAVSAYGSTFPLQAGMTLKADLILEDRYLWEMLLDPLLAVTR